MKRAFLTWSVRLLPLSSSLLPLAAAVLRRSPSGADELAHEVYGWVRGSRAPPHADIKLHIAVRQEDGGQGVEQQLLLSSHPASPLFRHHLSPGDLAALSAPASGSLAAVEAWLARHGLLSAAAPSAAAFIDLHTSVREAEQLLNATYFVYSDGTQHIIRTPFYHLPEEVANHIDFVTPTTAFPAPAPEPPCHPNPGESLSPTRTIEPSLHARATCGEDDSTPACIRQVYGIDLDQFNYTVQPDRTRFGVYATEGASFKPGDLQAFLSRYNPPAAQARASYDIVGNGDAANKGGIEAQFETALTTQTFLGLAWPAKGVLYNRGGVFGPKKGQTYDNFVNFLQELISNETVPSVISVSESAPENLLEPEYAKRLCNMMAQVGARGVSLLFSVGNNGPNGDKPGGEHKAVFEPKFPASCPWVTAVGGTTDLADEKAATKSTIPKSSIGYTASGGGFSNLFPRPEYQKKAVDAYISQHIPDMYHSVSGFTSKGRGYPDVSAFSTRFPTFNLRLEIPIGGTSAATPTWAAVITLLNDYEAFHGRPPLGFLNPWLYNLTSGLKDITKGGNNVGNCDPLQKCTLKEVYGYDVAVGWDAVTGLGSPRFDELVRALDSAAGSRANLTNASLPTTTGGVSSGNSSSNTPAANTNEAMALRMETWTTALVGVTIVSLSVI